MAPCYREGLMNTENSKKSRAKVLSDREKRLKAALKANMKRRKAQAKVRKASSSAETQVE